MKLEALQSAFNRYLKDKKVALSDAQRQFADGLIRQMADDDGQRAFLTARLTGKRFVFDHVINFAATQGNSEPYDTSQP